MSIETDTDRPSTPEEITARRQRRHTWYGYVADDTVEHIVERLHNLLDGRRYTFVAVNTDQPHVMPEVRTGQRIEPSKVDARRRDSNGIPVTRLGATDTWDGQPSTITGFTAVDTYGVWGVHTSHATEAEARDDADRSEASRERTTHMLIEGGQAPDAVGSRSRIEVTQYNGYGQKLHWVIAVELPDREEQ